MHMYRQTHDKYTKTLNHTNTRAFKINNGIINTVQNITNEYNISIKVFLVVLRAGTDVAELQT